MNYTRWNDDDLRRVLGANPKDLDAVIEAAARFDRAKSNSDFEDLEEKVQQLEGKLEEANDEARGWREDCEAEEKRSAGLMAEVDRLGDRIVELETRVVEMESSGAGLL